MNFISPATAKVGKVPGDAVGVVFIGANRGLKLPKVGNSWDMAPLATMV